MQTPQLIGHSAEPASIFEWAEAYVKQTRKDWSRASLALVMDIDDTVLRAYTNSFTAFPDIFRLYELAQALGYAIFFITARVDRNKNYEYTQTQLAQAGFHKYDGLFLMPPECLADSNWSKFKYSIRQGLHTAGYEIVLNIGDMWTDVALQPPYGTEQPLQKQIGTRTYAIIKPVDVAWMAIKLPSRPAKH